MMKHDLFNRRSKILAIAFALSLSAALIITGFVRYQNQPAKIVERLTRQVEHSAQMLNLEIAVLQTKLTEPEESVQSYLENHYSAYFEEKGQLFLIYQNNKLIYWTDNAFPAPEIFDTNQFAAPVINSGNGWFLARSERRGNFRIIGLQLLKYNYKYHNDYLPDYFFQKFQIPRNTELSPLNDSLHENLYKILSSDGKPLFCISFDGVPRPGPWAIPILFIFYTLSLVTLIALMFSLYRTVYSILRSNWLLPAFFLDVLIIRCLQFYFRFPAILYESDLFSPVYYASSDILPSLGDLFINMVLILQISWYTYQGLNRSSRPVSLKKIPRNIILVTGVILTGFLFHGMNLLIQSLVINSNIPFNLEGLFNLSVLSITGFTVVAGIMLAFLYFFYSLSRWIYHAGNSPISFLIAGLLVSVFYAAYILVIGEFNPYYSLFLAVLFVTFYLQHRKKPIGFIQLSQTVLFIFLLAILANYSLNVYNKHHELEKRKLLALHLTEYRDSLAEYKFSKVSNEMVFDDTLSQQLRKVQDHPEAEQEVINYLTNTYFNGYWSKFRVQIVICYSGKKLEIKPENTIVECCDYFNDIILKNGKQTSVSDLYFFDNALDMMYYTGRITLDPALTGLKMPFFIYVEITSKINYFALGYPQLLLDKNISEPENLFDYSYAIYKKGELVKSAGKYSYDIHELSERGSRGRSDNYNYKGYNHQVFTIDGNSNLIISHHKLSVSESIAPFSFIFIFLAVFMLIIQMTDGRSLALKRRKISFMIRLQAALVGIILASSVVIGTVTILNLIKLNETKNMDIVKEKMNSVRYELEILLSDYQHINFQDENLLSDALDRIANALFIDVNFFNADGGLISSSRRQIFDDKLISTQINPESQYNLLINHKSFYYHTETIGNYRFLSAYATVRNYDNKVIGIINLPYFSRQKEQKQELLNFLATFANTYIILIAIAIFLALFISRYITKPLQLIRSKLGNLQLGRQNAKIEWQGTDEIGDLVSEYNRMIDELGQKAELLAQSERESAWRQMARQVAHEIKNPLTPMKLSIQHLMRAWNDKAPDWEQRLRKFSQMLVMQIDTLSAIATEFSDFAQMPEPEIQRIDLVPLLNHSVDLFRNFSAITIAFLPSVDHCYINADENQMLRVFNNLIKNAVQAIPIGRNGNIRITLETSDRNCLIKVTDDGAGILPEQKDKIFSPNFTTKSAGMGLGLAMVKNIVDMSGGRIWFDSIPDDGTTFLVELPLAGG